MNMQKKNIVNMYNIGHKSRFHRICPSLESVRIAYGSKSLKQLIFYRKPDLIKNII